MKASVLVFLFWTCLYLCCFAGARGMHNANGLHTSNALSPDHDTAYLSAPVSYVSCAGCFNRLQPESGAKLNYTQIMFEHAQVANAEEYIIEVAPDIAGQSFEHPQVTEKDSSVAAMISNFEFGKKCVWRYTGVHNGKITGWNGPYSFEILNNPFVSPDVFKVNVLQNDSLLNAGGLIVMDISGTIINRNGKAVWFLPWHDVYEQQNMQSIINRRNMDMQVTAAGTVTSVSTYKAREFDLRGNITWQAPKRSGDYIDSLKPGSPYNYHHDFKRLSNGHYMVLDMEYLSWPDSLYTGTHLAADGTVQKDTAKVIAPYDIIKEFDRAGNLVWS